MRALAIFASCMLPCLLLLVGPAGSAEQASSPATVAGKSLSGRRVYKRVCMACHTLSVWGAPKLGDRVAWLPRISKGKAALYASATFGFNQMPARGNCEFCSDEELRAAVDYMVGKARRRPDETRP